MDNVKEQLQALAEAHENGIDTVSAAIQDLYMVIDHLTTQLRTADCTIAALKHVLIRNKTITAEELSDLQAKITTLFNKKQEDLGVKPDKPIVLSMEDELSLIHKAAKEASETPYDPQAFIFGS